MCAWGYRVLYVQSKRVLLVRPAQLKRSFVIWRLWLMRLHSSSTRRQRLYNSLYWQHYLTIKICISPTGQCEKCKITYTVACLLVLSHTNRLLTRMLDWYSKAYEQAFLNWGLTCHLWLLTANWGSWAFSAIWDHPFLAYLHGANLEWDEVWSLSSPFFPTCIV